MKRISFASGEWKKEWFRYVYSPKFDSTPSFAQERECIVNAGNLKENNFDYVSILTEDKFSTGVTIEATCSFENYGAPLIVISDDIYKGQNNEWYYGKHFEIVLYQGGINVWELDLNQGIMKTENLMRFRFPVTAGSLHTMQVKVLDSALDISMEEKSIRIKVDGLPKEFRVGLTACEGINRFYTLGITSGEE